MTLTALDTKARIIERYAQHVSSGKAEFFAQAGIDFVMGRREGVYVWDLEGARLINAHCNGGVFNLGHRHPRILAALRSALDELDIGNHHLMSEARGRLAERLAALSPGDINRVVFGVSGGEAVDMAIKLARGHTGRPKVISAVGGVAAGGGFVLAMMSDLRFGSENASFTTVFSKRGLVAEHGTSWMLPRLVGASRALDLLWSSRRVNADEALRIGLLDRVFPADELMAGVVEYVEQLAESVSPKSIATMKAQVYRHLGEGARPALEDSDRLTRASLDHPDAKEGAMALFERRAPKFQPWTGGA